MSYIKDLLSKYKHITAYLFWGVVTTCINWGIYFSLTELFSVSENIANPIAWFVCVTVAFFSNKKFVFYSKSTEKRKTLIEIGKFFVMRLLTLGVEQGILFAFVTTLHFNNGIVKIIASVIVVVLNYILSKIVVFKKEEKKA